MRKKNNQFNGYLYKQSSSIEILQKKTFFNTSGICYRHPSFFFKKTETKIIKGLIKDDEIRIIREHVVYFTVKSSQLGIQKFKCWRENFEVSK